MREHRDIFLKLNTLERPLWEGESPSHFRLSGIGRLDYSAPV